MVRELKKWQLYKDLHFIWWPGQGLSIPNHNSEGKSIEEQKKERIKNIEDLDEFSNRAEAYKRKRAMRTQK